MKDTLNTELKKPDIAGEKKITIHYFAALREQAGCQSEAIETRALDATALYVELQARRLIRLSASLIKVAVNGEFTTWDYPICDGDTVVFIPPVSGG